MMITMIIIITMMIIIIIIIIIIVQFDDDTSPVYFIVSKYKLVSSCLLLLVDVNSLDHSGRTALHNAILGCHEKIIVLLLESGADTSILDRSQDPPLHTAVRTGNEMLVKEIGRATCRERV